jgi:hypothetical protein
MVPEHLVEQSSFHPLMLPLEISQNRLANAKKDQYEDYGAEHFTSLRGKYWSFVIIVLGFIFEAICLFY